MSNYIQVCLKSAGDCSEIKHKKSSKPKSGIPYFMLVEIVQIYGCYIAPDEDYLLFSRFTEEPEGVNLLVSFRKTDSS